MTAVDSASLNYIAGAAARATGRSLTTLDEISALVSAPDVPMDFAFVMRFSRPLDVTTLRAGAVSAQRAFPVSACRIQGDRWAGPEVDAALTSTGPAVQPGTAAADEAIASFIDAPFDPRADRPVRQALFPHVRGPGATLVTRFHHAATDGAGAVAWLAHSLDVALAGRPPCATWLAADPPPLRRHARPARRSAFAPTGPAAPLPTRAPRGQGRRRWIDLSLPAHPGAAIPRTSDLAAAFLLALDHQRQRAGVRDRRPVGIWLPVDIRERTGVGFGNGSSRIRVYARPDRRPLSPSEVRVQMRWSLVHGEWSVPERPLRPLPARLRALALRAYVRRPWVDMATAPMTAFSAFADRPWARDLHATVCVGTLDRRHPLGLVAVTAVAGTTVTLTYDPDRLDREDVRAVADTFQHSLAQPEGDT